MKHWLFEVYNIHTDQNEVVTNQGETWQEAYLNFIIFIGLLDYVFKVTEFTVVPILRIEPYG